MRYKYNEDEWRDIRDKLFGTEKKQTISVRYSQEFVKEYLSHDSDDFNLRKSHNTLTLISNEEFAFLNSKELSGICDRIDRGKRNGTYYVVYHFKKPSGEFFVVNDILNEIAEMNKTKIRRNYEFQKQDLPKTTSSGRTISSCVSSLDSENIYYYDSGRTNRTNLVMLSKKPFNFPRGINGYDINARKVPVKSNANLFMLSYSLPSEVADVLKEPIIREIANAN